MKSILLITSLLMLTVPAQANPRCDRVGGRFQVTSPGPWPMYMSAKIGTTCQGTFRAGSRMVFKRLFVLTAPQRGKISLREGGYYLYSAPNQPGTDTFVLRICGVDHGHEGCADLNYSVAVN